MELINELKEIVGVKFSFGKSTTWQKAFNTQVNAFSMYDSGYGLGIPSYLTPEQQLRGVFNQINSHDGIFIFNINGVHLKKAMCGFENFDLAEMNNMITEWELSIILNNEDYYAKTIFHNGRVKFPCINYNIKYKLK